MNSKDTGAYAKSKTLAERAAWDFIVRTRAATMELAVGQSGGRVRAGARAGFLDLDPADAAPAGRELSPAVPTSPSAAWTSATWRTCTFGR